ncbi:hypothetical protein ACFQU2_28965 [Siccirubricoccus deserti]
MYRAAALGRPHVPILGLTADATPAAVARCRDAGMDGCLVKPVEPSRLAAAVLAHARPAPPWRCPHRLASLLPPGLGAGAGPGGAGQSDGAGRRRLCRRAAAGFPGRCGADDPAAGRGRRGR